MPKMLSSHVLVLSSLLIVGLVGCSLGTAGGSVPPPPPPPLTASAQTEQPSEAAEAGASAPSLGQPTPTTLTPGSVATTHLLWEWEETAPPSALAVSNDRLAVVVADGRFLWLDSETGQPVGGSFLWLDGIRGESWGQICTDEELATIAAIETWVSSTTGFPETRSQLIVFDREGNELWRLPELGDQHFYVTALAPDAVLAGTHRGFGTNILGAYGRTTGEVIWEVGGTATGYEAVIHNSGRLYVLLNDSSGGGVASYNLQTGEELWSQRDQAVQLADDLLLAGERLFVLTQPAIVALAPADGHILWRTSLDLAPEAGMDALADLLYVVPAPTAGLDYRPGIIGVRTGDGALAWHALIGLVADPLAAGDRVLWAIIKDYSSGQVWLSGLDAATGLEQVRLPIGDRPERLYGLVVSGRRVHVLGGSLLAFGY